MLRESLDSDVALIRQVAEYIIGGGGKRLRPALLLLTARACGYAGTRPPHAGGGDRDDPHGDAAARRRRRRIEAAARPRHRQRDVRQRRERAGRRFSLFARVPAHGGLGSLRVLEILSNATNVIAEGEVLQLINSGDPDLDEDAYLAVIQRKTAKLFEAAAQLGAVLGGAPPERRGRACALRHASRHRVPADRRRARLLGRPRRAIGKNLGDDLSEGKMTLPLIRAPRRWQRGRRRPDPRRDHRRRLDGIRAGRRTCLRAPARSTTRAAAPSAKAPPLRHVSTACPTRRTGKVC